MNKKTQKLRTLNIILGSLSLMVFGYALYVFLRLQPKMITYKVLSDLEAGMMTGVGFGLLIVIAFFLFSLLHMVNLAPLL